jgi:uncharacterized membrane protein
MYVPQLSHFPLWALATAFSLRSLQVLTSGHFVLWSIVRLAELVGRLASRCGDC